MHSPLRNRNLEQVDDSATTTTFVFFHKHLSKVEEVEMGEDISTALKEELLTRWQCVPRARAAVMRVCGV